LDWRFELLDPILSGAEAAAGLSAMPSPAGPISASSAGSLASGAGAGVDLVYGAAGTGGGQLDMALFRGPAPPPGVDGVEVVFFLSLAWPCTSLQTTSRPLASFTSSVLVSSCSDSNPRGTMGEFAA